MATALWRCLLTDSPLSQQLKDVKAYSNAIESKNIITINESSVFVWNADEQNILTVALKSWNTANEKDFQILLLSNPPSYDVDILQFNISSTLLAVHGKHGVSVIELPRKWGKNYSFEGGQKRVLCKAWGIASRFFTCNARIRIAQVSWHPGSSLDCHLCILSSDNYLRVYEATDPQTPSHVYNLGEQSPNCYLTSSSNMSFPASLGEVSVSFDFGPPRSETHTNDSLTSTTWPIFILKGNGDVFVVNSVLRKVRGQGQQLLGPLKMYPPAEDNYGVDACSLVCLKSTPPVLVIATCAGVIHHCIVLKTTDNEVDIPWRNEENESRESTADVSLYVYESIELALFLAQHGTGGDDAFSCPLRLHRDPTVSFRYHCTHVAGLHAIAVPIVQQLESYTYNNTSEDNLSSLMPILQDQDSIVEHLICTRPFPSSQNAPVLGLTVASTPMGATLICLLSSWEFVCLPLISACQMLPTGEGDRESTLPQASVGSDDFVQTLMNILQCSTHTPLLRTLNVEGNQEPSSQQCLELLGNVIQRLREEYIHRLELAETQVERRVKILVEQKKQLNSDLEKCMRARVELRDCAERMAEKYEDINASQLKLHQRVEELLEKLQRRFPILSNEEISMQRELQTMTEKLKNLDNFFQQIRLKHQFQQEQMKDQQLDNRRACTDSSFDSVQTRQIKELLVREGNTISELVTKANWLKKEFGL